VGTGPYVLDRWIPGQLVILSQNKAYWKGWPEGPHLRTVLLRVINDSSAQRLMLEKGDLDIALLLTVDDSIALQNNPQIVVRHDTPLAQFMMLLNTQKGPMKDVRVREALAYAFDYTGFIQGAMRGTVVRSYAPFPPEMTNGLPGIRPISRDLSRARQLLKDAGYQDGFTVRCNFNTGVDLQKRGCEILQASVADLGIKVEIGEAPWPTNLGRLQNPVTAYEVIPFYTEPFVNSPDTFLYPFYHSASQGRNGRNLGYYANLQIDRLLDQARTELNAERRRATYRDAAKILSEDYPAIYISRNVQIPGFRRRVKGFQFNPLKPFVFNFYEIYVE